MENGINVDPKALSREEFATAGVPVNGKPSPPFRNLHIRVRNQIVADGLDKPLNWQSAGYDMPPLEWHQKLKEAKEMREKSSRESNSDIPLILDCRNDYETNIGIFEGAEPLDTTSFRESWDVLADRLKDVPKDAPIMTYCTGGIRCVKVGAYLTQELGFTNVSRLAGGIIAYDRTLEQEAKGEEPMFRGSNMVFDGRLGRQITDDKLGSCLTCGGPTSLISNCLNDNCHKRMVQCETCRTSYHGTCSDACKLRLVKNSQMLPRRNNEASSVTESSKDETFSTLDEYSAGHSSPPPSLYKEIEHNTRAYLPSGSHMVSGFEQGRLLTNLASMTREGRVLELGTFTGYATACFLEGAANVASATNLESAGSRASGPYVLSMERDQRAFNLAAAHLKVMSEYGVGEAGAEVACALRGSDDAVEEIEDDMVSVVYDNAATCDLLKVSDALATLEAMSLGKSSAMEQPAPFDLVFIDADKTRLVDYVEACLDGDRILKKGGLIVVDNVLWKGLVLDAAGSSALLVDEEDADEAELKKNRRARKLASKMHRFNSAIVKDPRCEVLVLQVRDGLSMIRKK
jgi:predicted sulfurtransferase/predicted O-methyltransferase YrrM